MNELPCNLNLPDKANETIEWQRQVIEQLRRDLELLKADDAERCILIRDMEEEERRKDAVIEQQAQQIATLKSELSQRTNLEGSAPCWNSAHMKQITKLWEALEGMLFIFGHHDGYVQVKAAKQALKECP